MMRRKPGPRSRYLAVVFLLFSCQFFPTTTFADDQSAGTSGASYLFIPVGAKLTSVPDVVAALDPDGSLAFSNPAAAAGVDHTYAFFSRASWLEELSFNAASVVAPLPWYGMGMSVGTRLLHAGDLQGYDSAEQIVSEDSYYGMAISTALSKRFERSGITIGAGMTYMREHLPTETGTGVAMSFGAAYARNGHRVDLFAEEVGAEISFSGHDYPIDGRYVLGYGYALTRGWGRLDLGTQVTMSHYELRRLQLGAAYHMGRYFIIRSGVEQGFNIPETAQLPFTAGLGFRYGSFVLDYAFAPQDYFPASHTISVGFAFGAGHSGVTGVETSPPRSSQSEASSGAAPKAEKAPRETTNTTKTTDRAGSGVAAAGEFTIIAGVHKRAESARAEAQALQLVKVPAEVETSGSQYAVVVGRYESLERAKAALARYESRGHHFEIRPKSH